MAQQLQQRPESQADGPAQVDSLLREEFLEEYSDRNEAGQHTVIFGPTGRGKTTLMRDMLLEGVPYSNIGILSPKGADPAFRGIGRPKKAWPPHLPVEVHRYGEPKPYCIRLEGNPVAGWDHLRRQFEPPLRWARGQKDWLWVLPDLQAMSDAKFAGLNREVEWLMLTLRSQGSGLWVDAQRPSWIPRAAADQTRHVILFQNSDLGTVDRLRETISLPMKQMIPLMNNMKRHDFIWFDNVEDEIFYVDGRIREQ